jgi:hypothetical protein
MTTFSAIAFVENFEFILFKARAMRTGGLLARINESGQRTELMLRMGAERMEAAEARLQQDLRKQGLVSEHEPAENVTEYKPDSFERNDFEAVL